MSDSIERRVSKLEALPKPIPGNAAVWHCVRLVEQRLQVLAKSVDPEGQVLGLEILHAARDRTCTIDQLSTPALTLLVRLLREYESARTSELQ